LFESVRAVAQKLGLAVHDITAVEQDGQLFVELHLEVDEQLSLRDAHRQATRLEEGIRELREGKMDVNIHIEPLGRHIATPDTRAGEMRQLEISVDSFLNSLPGEYDELINCHDVRVRQVEQHILVSCHCVMKSELPITRVHDVTAALEDRVKKRFPQVSRVTIHPEPPEES
jgi:divalent metal cation (Fe/Co/Zn/Cd) transporter